MAHFNFENEVSKLIRMDAPITKGPQMRWQRKLSESINSSRNESVCNNSVLQSSQCSRTPKSKGLSSRTPRKTPGSGIKTPGIRIIFLSNHIPSAFILYDALWAAAWCIFASIDRNVSCALNHAQPECSVSSANNYEGVTGLKQMFLMGYLQLNVWWFEFCFNVTLR